MATATSNHRPPQSQPAHVIGRTVLEDGIEALLVPSGSEPGSTHLVRLIGPNGTYRCDCRAAQYHPERRCRHVEAAIEQDLAELLHARALKREYAAYREYLVNNYPPDGWN